MESARLLRKEEIRGIFAQYANLFLAGNTFSSSVSSLFRDELAAGKFVQI